MNLILWRHAEAEDFSSDLSDLGRQLTPRGHKQAEEMAEWLKGELPADAVILASPAIRTQQTADALERPYRIDSGIAPGARPESLISASGWPQAGGTTLLVGHQPTLGLLASSLLAGRELGWSVKKAAIWWLQYREQYGNCETVLRQMRTVRQ